MSTQRDLQWWFDLATQYYVAARFSAFAKLAPVCGNFFHHAIEMYLKGYLSSKLNPAQLKQLRHSLDKIWKRFKREASDLTLNRFDDVIRKLDKIEDIRYPKCIISHGMVVDIRLKRGRFSKGSIPFGSSSVTNLPHYEIIVEEMDSLVETIFEESSVHPQFFTQALKSDARTYLKRENAVARKLFGKWRRTVTLTVQKGHSEHLGTCAPE